VVVYEEKNEFICHEFRKKAVDNNRQGEF